MSKEAWKSARAEMNAIIDERNALLAPTKDRYEAALEKVHLIEAELGDYIGECEGCSHPLFDGDRHHSGDDVYLCESCAPTYADMLRNPDNFRGPDDEPMTLNAAKAIIYQHVSSGGSLNDKVMSS